ncbi:glutathione S-transferase N-terminal domain-containing protein [Acidisphaera sp. S103]|uniref:glutathione S-transferase N-terminal domain-containing protein n=1 Tax=Acidisphaera sp. S103 TaxID=1747223 RepID=UPI00131EC8F4|nr:glutathione S-transferase N-terminal domain-containing protein [Acidisphaera sp. S103]
MDLTVCERVGHEGRRPSPFSWRIRYALAHKQVRVAYRPTRFSEVDMIERLSGQRLVPVLVHDGVVVCDSWNIAIYLEDRFPDRPALFGGSASRATTRFLSHWADTTFHLPLRMMIFAEFIQCLCPEDRDYFVRSREAEFGMTIEQVRRKRSCYQKAFEAACLPFERLLGEQDFVGGPSPTYADYIVFSVFLQAHVCNSKDVLRPDSAIALWRSRMFTLFGGIDRVTSENEVVLSGSY